jgi:eukaryotic-like serine/threonine-protein kinase
MGTHGRYEMLRKIADGGMAEIFLAKQTGEEGFSRPVIVKRILPAYSNDPHFRDMLLDEAHIAMTLNHNNVVPVLDLGRAEGSYFLVMELVDGWDLAQVFDRSIGVSFPLPLGLSLYIVAEVCRGLAYAHARRDANGKLLSIVHRDVSPHNILVSEHGEVKITDFGIAKALGRRDRTQTGMIKGKLDFMSPEQASGKAIDASSDIFAAGTCLYLLATGRRPFVSPSDMEALLQVQRADFVPPDEVRPGLSSAVVEIIMRAMRVRPTDRYRNAEEMMLEIEAVMREEFASPGQSQLKRWLTELASRDGVPPLSRRPAIVEPQSLSSQWFAAGDMLSFDDSSQIGGLPPPARPVVAVPLKAPAPAPAFAQSGPVAAIPLATPSYAQPAYAAQPSAPVAMPAARPAPSYAAYAQVPMQSAAVAPLPVVPTNVPSRVAPRRLPRWVTQSRTMMTRSMLLAPPGGHWFLRLMAFTFLVLAAAGLAAAYFLPKEQLRKYSAEAGALVRRGMNELSSAIERRKQKVRAEEEARRAEEQAEEARVKKRRGGEPDGTTRAATGEPRPKAKAKAEAKAEAKPELKSAKAP